MIASEFVGPVFRRKRTRFGQEGDNINYFCHRKTLANAALPILLELSSTNYGIHYQLLRSAKKSAKLSKLFTFPVRASYLDCS